MGIKKIARPINSAKNKFLQWLKDNNAEDIHVFEGKDEDGDGDVWDYYRDVSAFVRDKLYVVRFMMYKGVVTIDYSDEENRYNDMSLDDFNQLLW